MAPLSLVVAAQSLVSRLSVVESAPMLEPSLSRTIRFDETIDRRRRSVGALLFNAVHVGSETQSVPGKQIET